MSKKRENILGYISLDTGKKAITPLNDVFLNYTFLRQEYWETLREMTNIFYKAYIKKHKDTNITPIKGEINVITQYPYYRNADSSTPKRQDMRIDSENKVDYIEFQNKTHPDLPIEVQSIEYLGFSLTRGENKYASNLWLLNGAITNLLQGNIFSNYILMDEADHRTHPNTSNVLYVDLKRLSQTNSQAGELAGILIGKVEAPKDAKIDQILQTLKNSFNVFKVDTEVRNIMTRVEQLEARGRAEVRAELLPLLNEQGEQLAEKDKKIKELETLLARE